MNLTLVEQDRWLSPQPPSSFCLESKNLTPLHTASLLSYVFPEALKALKAKNVPYKKHIPQ